MSQSPGAALVQPFVGEAGDEAERTPDALEAAALKGERAAWNELVSLHQRQVVLALVGAGVMPADARECAQEAWARLVTQAQEGKLPFLRLPGLVIRQALFVAKSRGRRQDARLAGEAGVLDDAAHESAELSFLRHEKLAKARERVERLPASSRKVFLMLYQEPHLSHAELAARVGLSVQRVRQIICEVRKVLRAEVEES